MTTSEFLILVTIFSAGMGPILRYGEVTVARISAFLLIILLFPSLKRIRSLSLLPLGFSIIYVSAIVAKEFTNFGRLPTDIFVYLGYGLCGSLVAVARFEKKAFSCFVSILLFIGGIAATTTVYEKYTGLNLITNEPILLHDGVTRAVGLQGDPNATADLILLGCMAAVYLLHKKKITFAIYFYILTYLFYLLLGLHATASRGAIISACFGLLIFVLIKGRSLQRFIILAVAVLAFFNLSFLLSERSFSLSDDYAAIERIQAYLIYFEGFLKSPILGDRNYYPLNLSGGSHNNFLEVFAYGGLVSGSAFILIHLAALKNYLTHAGNDDVKVIISCFAVLVGAGLTHTTLNSVIFWILAGLALNKKVGLKENPNEFIRATSGR